MTVPLIKGVLGAQARPGPLVTATKAMSKTPFCIPSQAHVPSSRAAVQDPNPVDRTRQQHALLGVGSKWQRRLTGFYGNCLPGRHRLSHWRVGGPRKGPPHSVLLAARHCHDNGMSLF